MCCFSINSGQAILSAYEEDPSKVRFLFDVFSFVVHWIWVDAIWLIYFCFCLF